VNPRDFLRESGHPIAILTAYAFDPIFFERLVLPDLWAGGSGSVMVFVDRRELDRSLDALVGRLRHLGRRYFLVPVSLPGAFHPKVFLRLGSEGGLAWIGSGNLTRGGWGANSELAAVWTLGEDPEADGWVGAFLNHLDSFLEDGLARDLLSRARRQAWLPDAAGAGPVLFTHARALSEQIEERWSGRRFESLRIITGSTDRDAGMLRWAVDHFGLKSVQLCVTPERIVLDPGAIQALGANVSFVSHPDDKPVHAKFFWFDGPDGPAVVWGSANASRAAWLLAGHNQEAVVVEDRPQAAEFEDALRVFEGEALDAAAVLARRDTDAGTVPRTEAPYRILRAARDTDGTVHVEVNPAVPEGTLVQLQVGGALLPLAGADSLWSGSTGGELLARETTIVRVALTLAGGELVWSSPHWVENAHELREVLAGRDFRSALESLGRFDSKQADYRLAHEIGRIGLELLHDSEAYPDHHPSPRRKKKEDKESEPRPPLDPEELLTDLGSLDPTAPSIHIGAAGSSVSGVFRALFARMDTTDDDAEVGEEGEDGDGGQPTPPGPGPRPPPSSQRTADADEKAQKLLKRHMERFFEEFEQESFTVACTATQLAHAVCYPIAVSLMAGHRGWCSVEDRHSWIGRAVRGLLQRDRYHHRMPMFDLVQTRYQDEDRLDVFHHAVGDGQLWLVLIVAIDALPGASPEDLLRKLTLFRDVLSRADFLQVVDEPSLMALFRDYYDSDAIEAARSQASTLGGSLRRVEQLLGESYDLLNSASGEGRARHRKGDLVWSPKGGWGMVEQEQQGEYVMVYAVQAGEVKKFKADGWWISVTGLLNSELASEALRAEATQLLEGLAG
jgi:hypothetical protein